jgi:hypothetical protein
MASHRDILRGHDSRPSDEYAKSLDRNHATLSLGFLGTMESDLVKAQSTLAKLAAEVDDLTRRLDRLTQR